MSTLDWLVYPLLLVLLGMIPFGYGDVREVPIIYMLQYFTPDFLLAFPGQRAAHVIDFHRVFVIYARDQVKGPIHLSTIITKIERSHGQTIITYRRPGQAGLATQKCSKPVLASPPVMYALKAANLDISDREKTVSGPVGIIKYWSGAVRVATPFPVAFAGFLKQTFFAVVDKLLDRVGLQDASFAEYIPWFITPVGQPVAWIRLYNASNVATTWSWGKYGSNQTHAEAKMLLEQVISEFNKDPTDTSAIPVPVTDADVIDFREWDYFPHFDKDQLDDGYYEKFNSLQGHMGTYYVSGLNGFETAEFAVRAGKDAANSYF